MSTRRPDSHGRRPRPGRAARASGHKPRARRNGADPAAPPGVMKAEMSRPGRDHRPPTGLRARPGHRACSGPAGPLLHTPPLGVGAQPWQGPPCLRKNRHCWGGRPTSGEGRELSLTLAPRVCPLGCVLGLDAVVPAPPTVRLYTERPIVRLSPSGLCPSPAGQPRPVSNVFLITIVLPPDHPSGVPQHRTPTPEIPHAVPNEPRRNAQRDVRHTYR